MLIKINKYVLKTYSTDLICVQKGNDTLSSSFDIRTPLNYIARNGYEDVKNRVEEVMIDFTDKVIDDSVVSFETKNYSIKKDMYISFEVTDKYHRNNTRYINKFNLLQKLYLLEINKLESKTLEELVTDINSLNNDFKKMMEKLNEKE